MSVDPGYSPARSRGPQRDRRPNNAEIQSAAMRTPLCRLPAEPDEIGSSDENRHREFEANPMTSLTAKSLPGFVNWQRLSNLSSSSRPSEVG